MDLGAVICRSAQPLAVPRTTDSLIGMIVRGHEGFAAIRTTRKGHTPPCIFAQYGTVRQERGIPRTNGEPLLGPSRYPLGSVSRESFNPKRALHDIATLSAGQVEQWIAAARYGGNPEHKRNPGDFGLTPPAGARMGKALCDQVHIFSRSAALELLRNGLRRGLVSRQQRDGWPQNVWAVTSVGEPLEAQHEGGGVYHGYPMAENDPFRDVVLQRWD
jgi:hypothetical protein